MAVASSGMRGDVRDPATRRAVSQMEKLELEDRHLRLMEENLALKKYSRSQEEKMKNCLTTKTFEDPYLEAKVVEIARVGRPATTNKIVMATKLLRLTADDKKEAKRDGLLLNGGGYRHGDVESELDDERSRNRELEKQNTSLKSKLLLLRQQLETKGKRHTPYDRVQSRISTGLGKRSQKSVSTDDISIKRPTVSGHDASTQSSSVSCHNLLDDVRRDNQELEEQLFHLRQEVSMLKAEKERSREQQRLRSFQFEEEKLNLQEEFQAQITALQKDNTESEMQLLKTRRDLKDKTTRLEALHTKHSTLERSNDLLKSSHSRVLQEMEILNHHLKEERTRTSQLQGDLHDSQLSQRTNSELQEMIDDLRSERDRVRQTNERLMKRQGDVVSSREQQLKTQLKSVQDQVREIEAERKTDVTERSKVINKLSTERELSEKLDQELRELRSTYLQLKEDYDQMRDKLSFFNKESSIDWSEVEEALVLVRQQKEKGVVSFLEKPDDLEVKGHLEIQELRASHADTINELEKTRKLLQMQHTINKEYKKEVESNKSRMADKEQDHSAQLQEYAQLLDIKAARIKKLESQLKDIAYGTRQVKVDTKRFEYGSEELEESVELERGQNLLQFHVAQVVLSSEAISHLHTSPPGMFVTFNFNGYETQVTSVKQGTRPHFGFTSSFVVTVDDSFLQQLQKGSISIEVNQALGFKYQTLAVASIKCKELITGSGGKVHGKAALTGVDSCQECVSVGSLEYWMRLKLPVTQAIRLYQERNKALSILDDKTHTPHTVTPHIPAHQPLQDPDYNELVVTIDKCVDIRLSDTGGSPSYYVMYKFYTFPDHDTPIVAHSPSPVFDDQQIYPLSMDQRLDDYLKTESLEVYVFDDTATDDNYAGVAQVPLEALARGETATGIFQFSTISGEPSGHIELSLQWKHTYHTRIQPPPTPPLNTHALTALPAALLTSPPVPSLGLQASVNDNSSVLPVTSRGRTSQNRSDRDKKKRKQMSKQQPTADASKVPASERNDEHSQVKPTGLEQIKNGQTKEHLQDKSAGVKQVASGQTKEYSQDKPTGIKQISTTIAPDTDTVSEETSALSESDSVSITSERRGHSSTRPTAEAKKLTKATTENVSYLSSRRAAPKVQSTKRSRNSNLTSTLSKIESKKGQEDACILKNSLPPLRQRHTVSSDRTKKDSKPKTSFPVPPSAHKPRSTILENDSEDFDITDTESVMSSLSGMNIDTNTGATVSIMHAPLEQPPVESTPTSLNDDSLVSLTSKEELDSPDSGAVPVEQDLVTATKISASVNSDTGDSRDGLEDGDGAEGVNSDTGDGGDSVEDGNSVQEEIEESLSEDGDEDTMFEETLHQSEDNSSGLSEHSSDELHPPLPTPIPSQRQELSYHTESEDDWSDVTPSEVEEDQDGNPITSNTLTAVSESASSYEDSVVSTAANSMSITIESFTLETDSSMESDPHVCNLFVEYQFLDFDYGELETPTSLPKPTLGETITFNFKKVFQLDSNRLKLLADMLKPGDPSEGRITFTVVADPDDQDGDCDELGSAEVDLNMILTSRKDLHSESIDVFSLEEDSETIGFLTVTVEALDILQKLTS